MMLQRCLSVLNDKINLGARTVFPCNRNLHKNILYAACMAYTVMNRFFSPRHVGNKTHNTTNCGCHKKF